MAVVFDEIESTVEPAMGAERSAQSSGPSDKPGGNSSDRLAGELERLSRHWMRLKAD